MIYIANQNTQGFTGKRGNMFLQYRIITDEVVQDVERESDILLIAYLDDRTFYLQQKKAGVPTCHLYQQTERALKNTFGNSHTVKFVSAHAAKEILGNSFVHEYART